MRAHVPALLFLLICVACGGEPKPPVVERPTTGRIQGVVVLSGANDSAGVQVQVAGTGLQALTDAAGAYSLSGVPEGHHNVIARASGYGEAQVHVPVSAGQVATADRLTLYATAPELRSSLPRLPVRGMLLTLRGRGFGSTQGAAQVHLGGEAVTEYTRWTDTEVQVRIPRTVSSGTVQAVLTMGPKEASLPVRVGKAVPIAAGTSTSLVLRPDGQVVAWGERFEGQTSVPVELKDVVRVGGGSAYSLALTAAGTVVAWGDRNLPQRGGTAVPAGLSEVVEVAAGSSHGLALKADGTVVAWGDNTYGQSTVPAGLSEVIAVATSGSHNLALKADGTVVAWGRNDHGESTVPEGLTDVVAVAGGGWHSLALKADGTVVAWGSNIDFNGHNQGQATVPEGLTDVVAISAGDWHSLALKADGTVVAWGSRQFAQGAVPPGVSNVIAVAAGGAHNLVLHADGTVRGWGMDHEGQATVAAGLTAFLP
jgi:hypothetical protein